MFVAFVVHRVFLVLVFIIFVSAGDESAAVPTAYKQRFRRMWRAFGDSRQP